MTAMLASDMGVPEIQSNRSAAAAPRPSERDRAQMRALVDFTARSMHTAYPRPFGASILETDSRRMLVRALNRVAQEKDPTAHAEVRAVRLATHKLGRVSLAGFTLYTTCEPCPMCMSAILWARLDRVVYGATIQDANRHCYQIRIPAAEVVARGDMPCAVTGPLLRRECRGLFSHPNMLRAFAKWTTRRNS